MKRIFSFEKNNPGSNRKAQSLLQNLLNEILTASYVRCYCKRHEIEKLREAVDQRNRVRLLLGGRPMTRKEIKTLRTRVSG